MGEASLMLGKMEDAVVPWGTFLFRFGAGPSTLTPGIVAQMDLISGTLLRRLAVWKTRSPPMTRWCGALANPPNPGSARGWRKLW